MHVSKVSLTGHIQRTQQTDGTNPLAGDDLNFLDWLTETSPVFQSANAEQANANETMNAVDKTKIVEGLLSAEPKNKTTEKVPEPEHAVVDDSADDDLSPNEITHLLHDALTTPDIQYLKQWVIPNVPIMMGQVPIQQLFPTNPDDNSISYKGFEVSDNLKALVDKGVKTGSPIRIELDQNASVILKFKNGRVSAEFLSNDQVSAWAVKQQLETLRQQLSSKNLPVDDLTYRFQQRNPQQQQQKQQNDDASENTEPFTLT